MEGKVTISIDDFDELRAQADFYKRLCRCIERSGLIFENFESLEICPGIKELLKEIIGDNYFT